MRNISSNRITYKLIPRFRHINCFLLSLFLWTPGWQTSAANWLTRFMWMEILSTLPRESIMKEFRAVLEKYNIYDSHVLEAFAKFSLYHLICFLCFYERQADKPARPIGWLGSCERKYCLLGAGKVLWKNFEPFWKNVTSKIVFSCMFLSIYCYERLFAVTDVSMNANRTN